jgi:radical SAM protein with 4Fe4S-binding SPASM domain
VLKNIFKEKAPNYTEIEVSYFQLCNLHCSFCWQDNYDPTGISTISEKADVAIDYLKREQLNLRPNIQVHMLGGELFEDQNDYYDQYLDFIFKIKSHCDRELPDKNVTFIFLTNMNFQRDSTVGKLERFLETLVASGCHFLLTTSWDPTGRPLKGEVSTRFHQNILQFKKYIAEITFVLTRPTIKRLLAGETYYLDLLYGEGFEIDYDYYMPTTNVDKLMPSDRELLHAFRFLIGRYPRISKLNAWTGTNTNPTKITCASLNKITILPDGTITNCRHLDYKNDDFKTDTLNESNSDMMMNFITSKECLSCTYFQKCPMSCFLMSDHKKFLGRKELDRCFYKILFEENES